jgi:hypothetical protein
MNELWNKQVSMYFFNIYFMNFWDLGTASTKVWKPRVYPINIRARL